MKVAILSGKGGTGKTLVSVNLAALLEEANYLDCDVEEPNGHLFFKPEGLIEKEINVKIPKVDMTMCDGCRKCVDFCNFNALAYIADRLIVFEEICHSCGGCVLVCPQKALTEIKRPIGVLQVGNSKGVKVCSGIMNTGEVSGVPIIKELIKIGKEAEVPTFIDCPPGSACIVMESIQDADYCILVAEPTIFGAHNLAMVYELVNLFDKPHGVVLNKCQEGDNPSEEFCLENNIKILGKIPYDEELGLLNSKGEILSRIEGDYKEIFLSLLEEIKKEVEA